ncbi:fibrous sheath CABYR-binding protein-like [Anthonomus grandis grandis]|uniref:fibrous sheath CABYR-binding protein-like n=1 Tax=Anthonomus grandis grandis TaxID=2921223 RepID=UPI002165BD13|nr:fibrous sheath CABYR-binding protein-like [Anthonomus grandis grandis]
MDNISPPPNASPEEIEAWNQMMDTMVTFIKASTNLMNTITTKVRFSSQAWMGTKGAKAVGGCEPECEACLPKPPPPPCGVCTEDNKTAAKKVPSSKTGVAKEPSGSLKSASAVKSPSAVAEAEPASAEGASSTDAHDIAFVSTEEETPAEDVPAEEVPAVDDNAEEAPGGEVPAEVTPTDEEAPAVVEEDDGENQEAEEAKKLDENELPEKEPAGGDNSKCCCSTIREERAQNKKSHCKCKKKKKKRDISSEAVIEEEQEDEAEEVEEVERKCGCGATPGNKEWLMQEMVVKLENAQSEITQLQEELAKLQRMDMSKKVGPHATPNPAKLYQEIMRGSQPPSSPTSRMYPQMMQPSLYAGNMTGYPDSGYNVRTNQTRMPNQSVNQLPNQSRNQLISQSLNRVPNQSANQSVTQPPNQSGNLPGKPDCDAPCAGLSKKEESETSLDCAPGCDGRTNSRTVTGYGSSMGQPQMRLTNSYQGAGGQNMGARSATPYPNVQQPPRRNSWGGNQAQMDPAGYNRGAPNFAQGQNFQQQNYIGGAAPPGYPLNLGPSDYYNLRGQYGVPAQPSVIRESVLCPSRSPCQDTPPPPKRILVCGPQQSRSQNLPSNFNDCSPDCPGGF